MNEKCPLEAGVMKQTGEDVKRIGSGDKAHGKQKAYAPGVEVKDEPASCYFCNLYSV